MHPTRPTWPPRHPFRQPSQSSQSSQANQPGNMIYEVIYWRALTFKLNISMCRMKRQYLPDNNNGQRQQQQHHHHDGDWLMVQMAIRNNNTVFMWSSSARDNMTFGGKRLSGGGQTARLTELWGVGVWANRRRKAAVQFQVYHYQYYYFYFGVGVVHEGTNGFSPLACCCTMDRETVYYYVDFSVRE